MKLIVTWLLGVPVAVVFFFSMFAVDASRLTPKNDATDATQSIVVSPTSERR